MAKYLKKKRANWFLRILFAVLLVIALLLGIVLWYFLDKLDRITYADEIAYATLGSVDSIIMEPVDDEIFEEEDSDYLVNIEDLPEVETVPIVLDEEAKTDDQVMNILLIGTDERTTEYNVNARADSMILVSIHKANHTVRLVSLERGIGVPILEGEYEGQYDLLTHVFRWGGADLLIKTVEHCFKVDVNHYVRLNFAAVENIVDAIGGIKVEMSKAEADRLNRHREERSSTGKQQPLNAGINLIDGGLALSFARLRDIDSDWHRVGRQRKVILGVVDALKDSSFLELNELADTVLPLIQTNLTKLEIAELILYSPNFLTSEFDQITIPKQGTYGGMKIRNGGGAFAVDYEINNDILYRFLYEGVSAAELLAE